MENDTNYKSEFIDYAFLHALDQCVALDIVGKDIEEGLKQLHAGVKLYFAPETIIGHLISMMYKNMENRYSQYQAREISDYLRQMLKAYSLQSSNRNSASVDERIEG